MPKRITVTLPDPDYFEGGLIHDGVDTRSPGWTDPGGRRWVASLAGVNHNSLGLIENLDDIRSTALAMLAAVERVEEERARCSRRRRCAGWTLPDHGCPGLCGRRIPRHRFACKPCWSRLPQDLREGIVGNGDHDGMAHRSAKSDATLWYLDHYRRRRADRHDSNPADTDVERLLSDDRDTVGNVRRIHRASGAFPCGTCQNEDIQPSSSRAADDTGPAAERQNLAGRLNPDQQATAWYKAQLAAALLRVVQAVSAPHCAAKPASRQVCDEEPVRSVAELIPEQANRRSCPASPEHSC
jgi:hypothetical protein